MSRTIAVLAIFCLCVNAAFSLAATPTSQASLVNPSSLDSTYDLILSGKNTTEYTNTTWKAVNTVTFGPGSANTTSYAYGIIFAGNISTIIRRTINATIAGSSSDSNEGAVIGDISITTNILVGVFATAVGPGYLAILNGGVSVSSVVSYEQVQVIIISPSGTLTTTTLTNNTGTVLSYLHGDIFYDMGSGVFFVTYATYSLPQSGPSFSLYVQGVTASTGTVYWKSPLSITRVSPAIGGVEYLSIGGDNYYNASNIYVAFKELTAGITYYSKTVKASSTTSAGATTFLVADTALGVYPGHYYVPIGAWASNYTYGISCSLRFVASAASISGNLIYSIQNFFNGSAATTMDSGLTNVSNAIPWGVVGYPLTTGYTLFAEWIPLSNIDTNTYVYGTFYANGTTHMTAIALASSLQGPMNTFEDANGTEWIGWSDMDTTNNVVYNLYLAILQGQLNSSTSSTSTHTSTSTSTHTSTSTSTSSTSSISLTSSTSTSSTSTSSTSTSSTSTSSTSTSSTSTSSTSTSTSTSTSQAATPTSQASLVSLSALNSTYDKILSGTNTSEYTSTTWMAVGDVIFGPGSANTTSYAYGLILNSSSFPTITKIIRRTINATIAGNSSDLNEGAVIGDTLFTTNIPFTSGHRAVGPGYYALVTTSIYANNPLIQVTIISPNGTLTTTTLATNPGADLFYDAQSIFYDMGSGVFFVAYLTYAFSPFNLPYSLYIQGVTASTAAVYWKSPLSIHTGANKIFYYYVGGDSYANSSNIYVVFKDFTAGITYYSKTVKATTTTFAGAATLLAADVTTGTTYPYTTFLPIGVWASEYTYGIGCSLEITAYSGANPTYSILNFLNGSATTTMDSGLTNVSSATPGSILGWPLTTGYTLLAGWTLNSNPAQTTYVYGTFYANGTTNMTTTTLASGLQGPMNTFQDVNGTEWIGWSDIDTTNQVVYNLYLAKLQGRLNPASSASTSTHTSTSTSTSSTSSTSTSTSISSTSTTTSSSSRTSTTSSKTTSTTSSTTTSSTTSTPTTIFTVDVYITYDVTVNDFENTYTGNTTLIDEVVIILNIPAEWIIIISVSSASSRRRLLQTTDRILTSSSSQTIVVVEITINSGGAQGSIPLSYADPLALEKAFNAAVSNGSLAIGGRSPVSISYQVITNNSRNVRLIVGLSVGFPLGIITIVIIVYIWYKRTQKRKNAYREPPISREPNQIDNSLKGKKNFKKSAHLEANKESLPDSNLLQENVGVIQGVSHPKKEEHPGSVELRHQLPRAGSPHIVPTGSEIENLGHYGNQNQAEVTAPVKIAGVHVIRLFNGQEELSIQLTKDNNSYLCAEGPSPNFYPASNGNV